MLCPCDERNKSSVLYSSKEKNGNFDVRCTSEIHEKPTLYKCKKCNYYWFYKYWEDELDMDWMMKTEKFETPRICRIMVPITEKEYSLFTKTPKKSISYKMFSNRKQFIRRKQ